MILQSLNASFPLVQFTFMYFSDVYYLMDEGTLGGTQEAP